MRVNESPNRAAAAALERRLAVGLTAANVAGGVLVFVFIGLVVPGTLDDDGAVLLSHEIAREIEQQLEYPGQIKVTVIRESRATDYAR